MRIAILDPFSGISGDMTLGALLGVGLDPEWLRALPATLGLTDVRSRSARCMRARSRVLEGRLRRFRHSRTAGTSTRSASSSRESGAPDDVQAQADRAFWAIAAGGGARFTGRRPRRCTCTRSARSTPSSTSSARSGDSPSSASRRCAAVCFAPATAPSERRTVFCPCPRRRRSSCSRDTT